MKLRERIEKSWTINTTYCPDDYNHQPKSWGQCAVTAILLRRFYKGKFIKAWATMPNGKKVRHYWNKIKGIHVDLTWNQFPQGTFLTEIQEATELDLVQNSWMHQRYLVLLANFKENK